MTDQEKQFLNEMVYLYFTQAEAQPRIYVKIAAENLGISELAARGMLEASNMKSVFPEEIRKYQAVLNNEETKEVASRVMWDALKVHVSGLNQ